MPRPGGRLRPRHPDPRVYRGGEAGEEGVHAFAGPNGERIGAQRGRRATVYFAFSRAVRSTPTPTLPHQGGGGNKSGRLQTPSPLVGEGWGGGCLHGITIWQDRKSTRLNSSH